MVVHPVTGGQRLGVDRVERRHRDPVVVERDAQRVLVDQRAAGDVDEVHARLHPREHVGVEQMPGAWQSRARRSRGGRRPATSSPIDETISTPSTGLGASVRRIARTRMPNASARRGDRAADAAQPDERERAAGRRESSAGFGKFQCLGGSSSHVCGIRFAHASTAAITHSEIGNALAPRAQVTMRPLVDRGRDLVDTRTRGLHPAHSGRVDPTDDVVPGEVPAEEHVGNESGGRVAAGELDHLDVGMGLGDARRRGRTHLVDHTERHGRGS